METNETLQVNENCLDCPNNQIGSCALASTIENLRELTQSSVDVTTSVGIGSGYRDLANRKISNARALSLTILHDQYLAIDEDQGPSACGPGIAAQPYLQ